MKIEEITLGGRKAFSFIYDFPALLLKLLGYADIEEQLKIATSPEVFEKLHAFLSLEIYRHNLGSRLISVLRKRIEEG